MDAEEPILEYDHSKNTQKEKGQELRLSTFTEERAGRLESIRNMGFWERTFRPLAKGSLRGVVIMWIRMTLGVGVLTLPYYISIYGYGIGVLAIVAAGLINLHSFYNIFAASTALNEKNYLNLIEKSLGKIIFNIFKVTFFLDMSSSFIILIIVCWNLFEYSLFFLNLVPDQWFSDKDKMQFNENYPSVASLRGWFCLILFTVSIPLFLKRTLQAFQSITIILLFLLLTLLGFIICQSPFFYLANTDTPRIQAKPFNPIWIESFFSILLSFYVQPFIFSLRDELLFPSQKRMNKVARITISFEIVLCVAVGFAGYMSLGEKYMTSLFLTRAPYKGESMIVEHAYRLIIGLFFLLTSIGIAIFNPTMRDYLHQALNLGDSKKIYVMTSLLPFATFCIISYAKPSIVDVFNWTGLTICNFNGYIVPSLMRIQVLRLKNGPKGRLALEVIHVVAIAALGILGVVYKFKAGP